ncbi:filamentous hemagglutinin N-terminal domain-containing protein, partial [Sodalis-like symbiont of Bactericera trigonica]
AAQTEAARHADRHEHARFAFKRPAYPTAHQLSPRLPPGGRFLGLAWLLIAPPLVNICAPNRTGISYNQFHYFDVDARGVILNNARTVNQTELAGQVDANPQLTREATLIINEVTQQHPSLLDGFIEVAGQRADVIIANPAGISCSGCGFINVRAGTLTTGHP